MRTFLIKATCDREHGMFIGWRKVHNFLKFIHRPHIKNCSKEFSKMRRVQERSGA